MASALYRCPRTGAALVAEGAALASEGGDPRYPVVDRVPVLLVRPSPPPGRFAALPAALAATPAEAWPRVLAQLLGPNSPELAYAAEERFAALATLLPIGPDTRVLEVGASFGQQSVVFARRTRRLHTLERMLGAARVARRRLDAEGLGHVEVAAGGDADRLPYADGAFDLVVLNLVLEWCGADAEGPHPRAQRRLLEAIHRVLAPGGRLFVGTKSRYAAHLLLGGRDEHLAQLRFGSALPRRVARALLALSGVSRAPGHLHSPRSLARLLACVGFEAIDPWVAWPDALRPTRYVHADARAIRDARADLDAGALAHGRLPNALLRAVPACWVPALSGGLAVLARRRA